MNVRLAGPTDRAAMQLNIAAARTAPAEITPGVIAVRHRDVEEVVAARFTFVARKDRASAGAAIDIDVVIDPARGRINNRIAGDSGRSHVHSTAMIDVIQVAPELAASDAAADA